MKKRLTSLGVDLGYRPQSYFWALDSHIRLASDITGAKRRAMYEAALRNGQHAIASALMETPELEGEDRQMMGLIHPDFMGGEYLPKKRGQEVEIARIVIASTTRDVTCVYARRGKSRIYYRVVDEYGGDTLANPTRTSIRPLTLSQLTDFFLSSWDLLNVLDGNFDRDGYPRHEVHGFIVDASSSFYAEFGDLVYEIVDAWVDEKHADFEEDEEE